MPDFGVWNLFNPDAQKVAMNSPEQPPFYLADTPDIKAAREEQAKKRIAEALVQKAAEESLATPDQAPTPDTPAQTPSRAPTSFGPLQKRTGPVGGVYGDEYNAGLSDRSGAISALQDQLSKLGPEPDKFDRMNLKPFLAFSDSFNGGHSAQSYDGPAMAQDFDQKKALLQKAVADQQNKISDDKLAYLKLMSDRDNKDQLADLKMRIAEMKGAKGAGESSPFDLRQAQEGARAANRIHVDPGLKDMVGQGRNIDKGMGIISHNPTWNQLHEFAQDFTKALSGSGVSSDLKLKSILTPSLDEKIGTTKSFWSSNPNQPANPEMVAYWRDMGQRLQQAYDRQITSRAASRLAGLKDAYGKFPIVYDAAKTAAQSYANGNWRNVSGDGFDDIESMPGVGAEGSSGSGPGGSMGFDEFLKKKSK